jgi:hypothetical protein
LQALILPRKVNAMIVNELTFGSLVIENSNPFLKEYKLVLQ